MQDAQDFNPFPFDTVDGNERGAADDQLAGSLHPSFTPHQGMLGEQVYLAVDLLIHPDCSSHIICGDVIQLLKPSAEGGFEPGDRQIAAFSASALARHFSLLPALCRFAST